MYAVYQLQYTACSVVYVFISPVNLLIFAPLRRVFTRVLPQLLWVTYVQHPTRTPNFCEFCTAFIPLPDTCCVSYVCQCLNTRGTGYSIRIVTRNFCELWKTSIPYPQLLWLLYNIHTRTLNFCEFCTTVISVPETSVSSVRPCHNIWGTGTSFIYSTRHRTRNW